MPHRQGDPMLHLSNQLKNVCPHKNLDVNVHSSFTNHHQNCKQPRCLFDKLMIMSWYVSTMEYYSVIKRNDMSSQKRYGRNLNIYC